MNTIQKWKGFGARPTHEVLDDQADNLTGHQLLGQAPQIFAAAMAKGLIRTGQQATPSQEGSRKTCMRCDRVLAGLATSQICFDCLVQIERAGDSCRVLMRLVCATFAVGEAEIFGKSRLEHIVEARHALAYCLHELCGLGWSQIGRFIGLTHRAIMHAHQHITDCMEVEALLKGRVQRVIEEFSRGTKPKAAAACVDDAHLVGAGCRHPQH